MNEYSNTHAVFAGYYGSIDNIPGEVEVYVPLSKQGTPLLLEMGGATKNTGSAIVVAFPRCERPYASWVALSGPRANGVHAAFKAQRGMLVCAASHHRGVFTVALWRVAKVRHGSDKPGYGLVKLTLVDAYVDKRDSDLMPRSWSASNEIHLFRGVWLHNSRYKKGHRQVILAAVEKALCYHCRQPHYADMNSVAGKVNRTPDSLVCPGDYVTIEKPVVFFTPREYKEAHSES